MLLWFATFASIVGFCVGIILEYDTVWLIIFGVLSVLGIIGICCYKASRKEKMECPSVFDICVPDCDCDCGSCDC